MTELRQEKKRIINKSWFWSIQKILNIGTFVISGMLLIFGISTYLQDIITLKLFLLFFVVGLILLLGGIINSHILEQYTDMAMDYRYQKQVAQSGFTEEAFQNIEKAMKDKMVSMLNTIEESNRKADGILKKEIANYKKEANSKLQEELTKGRDLLKEEFQKILDLLGKQNTELTANKEDLKTLMSGFKESVNVLTEQGANATLKEEELNKLKNQLNTIIEQSVAPKEIEAKPESQQEGTVLTDEQKLDNEPSEEFGDAEEEEEDSKKWQVLNIGGAVDDDNPEDIDIVF